ncbi:MAG TPA: TM0106 family RecB-like putative nuclease [Sedimentisphaerales bacterium]|nr:TM0106 family RecB-like putative nuclease [Sedimentisphaerales bacterium]
MKLTVSDIYTYYRPSKCGLRVNLKERGVEGAAPGPYEQVLERLGQEHERRHLAIFPSVVDLSPGTLDERVTRTKEAIEKRSPVIYQGVLKVNSVIGGTDCEISGVPDFLILDDTGAYAVCDSKISRRINEKDHAEIILQIGTYGWLFDQTFGQPPNRLQVHSGTGEIVDIPYDHGSAALEALDTILGFKQLTSEPYSPVGWSKCNGCPFHSRCWPQAEKNQDVAIVAGVDQGLARALREEGVETIEQFLSSFDEEQLAQFHRPWGKKTRRVGKEATAIVRMARAIASSEEILIQTPTVPESPNYVMFDLEGLPPQLDEIDKTYLWGMQVFGDRPCDYVASTAGFGDDGDRQGWENFLEEAKRIFEGYGDIPFVHWHHYERIRLDMYIERFGDPEGVAARVKENLLDLLPITQKSIALPLPIYSLKVVEQYIGFERTQDEYGGTWAMAKYIEATEMADEKQRAEVMDEILTYNEEDLQATWAVLRWLKSKTD